MRKLLIVMLALSLGGCANLTRFVDAIPDLTASYANPVTPERLYQIENAGIVLFAGLNAYKRTCVQKVIPQSCRQVIKTLQVYTRQIPPALEQLRAFVRNNDQVNAISIFNAIGDMIARTRSIAAANNVPLENK